MSQPTHAVRTAVIVSAFCGCLLLLDQTNARAQEPSAESPTRFQVGIGFLGAGGIGDFGARTDGAAGLLLHTDFQLGASIFSVGGEGAWMSYGDESRDAYIGNVIPDMPNLTLKVDTSNELWFLHGRLRAQKRTGRWRPYGDGLVGLMNISTTTSINGAQSCTGGVNGVPTSCSADQAASVTNADDYVLSVGGGAGTIIAFGQRAMVPRLDISVRYQHGGDATYLTQGAIVRQGETAIYNFSRSPIDMVTFYFGVAIGR